LKKYIDSKDMNKRQLVKSKVAFYSLKKLPFFYYALTKPKSYHINLVAFSIKKVAINIKKVALNIILVALNIKKVAFNISRWLDKKINPLSKNS
jgi:hypothetical protein